MMVACSCSIGSTFNGPIELCPMHGPRPNCTLTISSNNNGREGEVMQDENSTITLSISDSNHLRRLLGWVDCEIGQAPEEMINTFADLAPALGPDICEEGKERISESYQKSKNVPKYIRSAIKALRKIERKATGK